MKIEEIDETTLTNLYQNFCSSLDKIKNWVDFMESNENITPKTAEMMVKQLNDINYKYVLLYDTIKDFINNRNEKIK